MKEAQGGTEKDREGQRVTGGNGEGQRGRYEGLFAVQLDSSSHIRGRCGILQSGLQTGIPSIWLNDYPVFKRKNIEIVSLHDLD